MRFLSTLDMMFPTPNTLLPVHVKRATGSRGPGALSEIVDREIWVSKPVRKLPPVYPRRVTALIFFGRPKFGRPRALTLEPLTVLRPSNAHPRLYPKTVTGGRSNACDRY